MSTDLEHSHGALGGMQGFYVVPCGCGERFAGPSPMKAELSWSRHTLEVFKSEADAAWEEVRKTARARARESLPEHPGSSPTDEPKRLGDLLPPAPVDGA